MGTGTFTVTRDTTPPDVWLDVPRRVCTTTIAVTWGATDTQAGVAWYDLDVRVDGEWQRVLTQTQATSYLLTANGSYFTFRVTATDNVSNAESTEATSSLARVTKYYYHAGLLSYPVCRIIMPLRGAGKERGRAND